MATTRAPRGPSRTNPRARVKRKAGPISASPAVAPKQTITEGAILSISASNQPRQASTWPLLGF